ncbi:hypothetical protein PAPHI01_1405 [Pancytospora philotis]|nr:hypothetical protein PAPHI01_1405 [Pancytospora philotis]
MASSASSGPLRVVYALLVLLSLLPVLRCSDEVDYNSDGADLGTIELSSYSRLPGYKNWIELEFTAKYEHADSYKTYIIVCENAGVTWRYVLTSGKYGKKEERSTRGPCPYSVSFIYEDQMWYAIALRPKSSPDRYIYCTKPIFVDVAGKFDKSKLVCPQKPIGGDFSQYTSCTFLWAMCPIHLKAIFILGLAVMLLRGFIWFMIGLIAVFLQIAVWVRSK